MFFLFNPLINSGHDVGILSLVGCVMSLHKSAIGLDFNCSKVGSMRGSWDVNELIPTRNSIELHSTTRHNMMQSTDRNCTLLSHISNVFFFTQSSPIHKWKKNASNN